MSDYIYMLESHLSPDQNRAVEEVQAAAGLANVNVFLTGGAMRDMLAGFRIRDLDFVVEGNALKIAKAICERTRSHHGFHRREPQDRRTRLSQRCHRADRHVAPGKVRPRRRQTAGFAGHHSGRSARPRFHLQRHRAFAQPRLPRPPAGPHERPGRYRAQRVARRQHLRLLRRSLAPAAPGPLPRPHGLHGRRTHPDAGCQRARSRSRKAHSRAGPGRRTQAHQRRRQSNRDLQRPGRGRTAAPLLTRAGHEIERGRPGAATRRRSASCRTMRAGALPASGPSSTAWSKSSRPRTNRR